MTTLDFHGGRVHYHFEGAELPGTPLVLLHGFLEDSTMWDGICGQFLSKRPVLRIDLPGHGLTDSFGYEHTMDFMADAVFAVLQHLGIQPSIMLGHSMGGYVALAFAQEYSEHLHGLGLFFSTPEPDSPERKIMRDRAADLVKQNKNAFIRAAIPQLFDEEMRAKHKDEIRAQIDKSLNMSTQGILAAIMGMKARPDYSRLLAQPPAELAPARIGVFSGTTDTVIPFAKVQQWWTLPGVGFRFQSTHGHMGHISDEKNCAAQIESWIATLD